MNYTMTLGLDTEGSHFSSTIQEQKALVLSKSRVSLYIFRATAFTITEN